MEWGEGLQLHARQEKKMWKIMRNYIPIKKSMSGIKSVV